MKYTSLALALIILLIAFLLLLSSESRAAYRMPKVSALTASLMQAGQQGVRAGDSNVLPAEHDTLKHNQHPSNQNKPDHRKRTSAEFSLTAGAVGLVFFAIGFSVFLSLGSISSLGALFFIGAVGIATPSLLGIVAVMEGIKGLKIKKQRNMAIAGVVLGVLLLLGVAAIFAL